MARKNYFAIVHKENGELLVDSGLLPIYWTKSLAKRVANGYKNYIVKPVDIKAMNELILTNIQKK